MSTSSQSPPGRRLASSFCMPNSTYDLRRNLTEYSCMWSMREYGFFQSKSYSGALTDDFNKKEVAHRGQFYLRPFNPSKFEIHPPGICYTSMDNIEDSESPFLSISNFITQVVPQSLPSRDSYKTFICKGLFTTHQAIQKSSRRSSMEKTYPEPLVTRLRSHFERFWLLDRNSVPGSTGIGLVPSLRPLSMTLFSCLKISFASTTRILAKYLCFIIFLIHYPFISFHNEDFNYRSAKLKPFFDPHEAGVRTS